MTVEDKELKSAAPSVADLIIEDTIFSAHTNPEMRGDATVQDALDLMEGSQADVVVQDMMAQYCLSEIAGKASGTKPGLDIRLIQKLNEEPLRLTAKELKEELISGLQRYLELPSEERKIFQQKIIEQKRPSS